MKATQVEQSTTIRIAVTIEPEGDEWAQPGPDLGYGRKGQFRAIRIELLRTIKDGEFRDDFYFTARAILKDGSLGRLVHDHLYDWSGHRPEWLESALAMARVEAEAAIALRT